MTTAFYQVIKQISEDRMLFQDGEEATRQGAILPILNQLGWKVFDINEVTPEFKVGDGRVDYCLRIGSKKAVFIEVKRPTEDLERHEEQLLKYSFTDGVEIAILTNGFVWWFYLPLDSGMWQQRKFFTIDIKQQAPEVACSHFIEFLGRDTVASGNALFKAKEIKAGKEKEKLISQTIPKAWEYLLSEPDELLVELFADTVESMCGHRPELEQLAQRLKIFNHLLPQSSDEVTIQDTPKSVKTGLIKAEDSSTKQKGVTVQIDGMEINATSVSSLYYQALKFLCDNKHIDTIKPHLPYATSAVRYLISNKPYHQRGNEFRVPVEYDGYYMEAHKAYRIALRHLDDLLRVAGLSMRQISK